MYAQLLIYVGLFVFFVWGVWKLIGKHIVKKIEEPKTPEEQREALKKKIIALKAYKKTMEDVEQEIEITSELTKVKRELNNAEKKLEKLDDVLENIGKKLSKKEEVHTTETSQNGEV